MNRLLLAAGLLCMMNACNDQEAKHAGHAAGDSTSHQGHQAQHEAGGNNEMKNLMDGMMIKMHQQKNTGNNDIDYANMMLQHHQAAVDMANLQQNKGTDTTLKNFSKGVVNAQQKEIKLMGEFVSKATATASPDNGQFKKAMDASMETMMSASPVIYNNIDKDFVAQMIPHHQSAVDMAMAYLQYGKDGQLRKMSEDIISSQEKEIGWLKSWQPGN